MKGFDSSFQLHVPTIFLSLIANIDEYDDISFHSIAIGFLVKSTEIVSFQQYEKE